MALTTCFWGTRGNVMSVARERLIYGGHTTCLAVHHGEEMLIIDAGFGLANLAASHNSENPASKGGHKFNLILSHFHWDHIQGLSYFIPIYFPGNEIVIHSPFEREVVTEILNLLFDGSYSPFNGLDSLPCTWTFRKLEHDAEIGSFRVDFHETAHVGETYAFKLATDTGSIVVATDHDASRTQVNDSLVDWAQGCDMLVHSAMYTPREHLQLGGFGHSSFIEAVRNAERIGAAHTLLTHHAPLRNDGELAEMEHNLQHMYNTDTHRLSFAREGAIYRVR